MDDDFDAPQTIIARPGELEAYIGQLLLLNSWPRPPVVLYPDTSSTNSGYTADDIRAKIDALRNKRYS